MRCQWGEAEWGRTGKIQSFKKPAWCLGYLYRYTCLSLLLYCWKEWTKRFATFESNIQKYNFCFRYLFRECGPSVEIVLGLVKCTYKFLIFFCLNSRNPIMEFPIFKILQGKLLMYSGIFGCCLPRDCLCRSAAICLGKSSNTYLRGLVEMGLFPSDRDKQANSTKKNVLLETFQGETPISDTTSKTSRSHSVINHKFSLLKHRKHEVVKGYLWDAVYGKCFAKQEYMIVKGPSSHKMFPFAKTCQWVHVFM